MSNDMDNIAIIILDHIVLKCNHVKYLGLIVNKVAILDEDAMQKIRVSYVEGFL